MEHSPKEPVPVFPLPDLMLFPQTVLPVHVFELRYRTMVRDALSRGRILAMALLKPGWEPDYQGSPEFFPIGCLARIEEVEWLPNDCYDLKLRGLSRVRLDRLIREYPYRSARVQILPDAPFTEDDPLVQMDKQALFEVYRRWGAVRKPESYAAPPEIDEAISYATLVNTACMLVECAPTERVALLELDSVFDRGRRVRELMLEQLGRTDVAKRKGGEQN